MTTTEPTTADLAESINHARDVVNRVAATDAGLGEALDNFTAPPDELVGAFDSVYQVLDALCLVVADLATEVRTRRLVVEDEDGSERITIEHGGDHGYDDEARTRIEAGSINLLVGSPGSYRSWVSVTAIDDNASVTIGLDGRQDSFMLLSEQEKGRQRVMRRRAASPVAPPDGVPTPTRGTPELRAVLRAIHTALIYIDGKPLNEHGRVELGQVLDDIQDWLLDDEVTA